MTAKEINDLDVTELSDEDLISLINETTEKRDAISYEVGLDYNIKDTELIKKFEEKLGLIQLATMIAYMTHVNYTDTFKQVRMWSIFTYYWLYQRNIIPPITLPSTKEYKYEGAYVKEPQKGKYGWVMSFDINSLYPNIIRTCNISPETLQNETYENVSVEKFLHEKVTLNETKCSVAANGTRYTNDYAGMFPSMMSDLLAQRKKDKNAMLESEKKLTQNPNDEQEQKNHGIYKTRQSALKVLANSAYGAIGSEYFPYYSTPLAEAVTTTGQLIIRWINKYINEYMSNLLKTNDVDYVIYTDTDSTVINVQSIIDQYLPNEQSIDKIVTFLNRVAEDKIEIVIENAMNDISKYMNFKSPDVLGMKKEIIASSALWSGKKRYAMNVYDSEGVRYEKPKMKIMGLETAKSSTPAVVREYMEELLYKVLNEDEESCQKYIRKVKKKFLQHNIEDIAFPRGVNGLSKYKDDVHIYAKGTPIHVRGALLYNHYIRQWNLEKQYEQITEGAKIKFIHLKEPNPIHENIFGFLDLFPRNTGLQEYVDYEKMFEKTFVEPMKYIFDAVGWSMKKQRTLEAFFE